MSDARFAVMILNLNGSRWLSGIYDSLRMDGYVNKRVYLVDNGSTDGSQEFTRDRYPEVSILQMPRNLGYSMAYNAAAATAFADGCDWIVWQNNDTLVVPGWLDRFAAAAVDPQIGVMGAVFRNWHGDGPNDFMQSRHPDVVPFMEDLTRPPIDCDWVEGSACAVRRACIEDVGPLEASFFMFWEEADFCRRARHQGWRVVLVPGAVVRHYGGGTAADTNRLGPLARRKTRNQYVYTFCAPDRALLRNVIASIQLVLVNTKAALQSPAPVAMLWHQARSFAWFLAGLPWWIAKWLRNRKAAPRQRFRSCVAE